MSIGLLLVLNFLTIPFLQEAEELGKRKGKFPAFIDIFYLRNTLKQRWFKLYCIFMLIFLAMAFAPTASEKQYPAGLGLILSVLAVQAMLWLFVHFKISKLKK